MLSMIPAAAGVTQQARISAHLGQPSWGCVGAQPGPACALLHNLPDLLLHARWLALDLRGELHVQVMRQDVIHAAACGAAGVSLGMVTARGSVATDQLRPFVELCCGLGGWGGMVGCSAVCCFVGGCVGAVGGWVVRGWKAQQITLGEAR